MKILVTGATGFIGKRLVEMCLDRGDVVRVLTLANNSREERNRVELEKLGVETIVGSVTDKQVVHQALDGIEVIYHLAAVQHEMNVPDSKFWEVNVEGTHNLLEESSKHPIKCFLYGSTIGVYGSMKGVINENSPCKPANIYGKTKFEAEKLVRMHSDKIPAVIIRISETYGPGDYRLLKLFKTINKNLPFIIGNGKNLHHLIFVDDLIKGFFKAINNPQAFGEIIVLSGKEIITTQQMIETIAEILQKSPPKLKLPLWPFYGLAWVMEIVFRPLGIQPPLHRRRMDFFIKSFQFSQEKMRNMLKYEPETSFRDGVYITARWYQKMNLL